MITIEWLYIQQFIKANYCVLCIRGFYSFRTDFNLIYSGDIWFDRLPYEWNINGFLSMIVALFCMHNCQLCNLTAW